MNAMTACIAMQVAWLRAGRPGAHDQQTLFPADRHRPAEVTAGLRADKRRKARKR